MAGRASVDSPGDASPWPASILLAQEAYVAASRNHTTATAKSRVDHTVEVTFWIADPPAVSFYTFHCSKPPTSDSDSEDAADLQVQPHLVGAEGRFVVIRTFFASGDGDFEYFIYKGDPRSPSLESVPLPDDDRLHGACEFGIVPRGDGDHYLLIALCDTATLKDYRLHIYSSEDRAWRTKELLNPCPGVLTITQDKVMLLRDGVLVWVDLLCGMLVCDVLQEREPLHTRYIPLPEPLPRNREQILKQLIPGAGVRRIRDVAYVDGLIKFVEMEHRVTVTEIVEVPPEKPSDPRNKTVLYDSDLIMLYKRKHVDNKPKTLRTMNGWSAMTWTREIGSDCWLKGVIVDADDILVDDSAFSGLLSGQRNESAGSLAFKNMHSACPTLNTESGSTWGAPFWKIFSFVSNVPSVCIGEPSKNDSWLLAEKANHAQNLAHSTVRNVHSSQACPDQNNMPPQRCFNRWEGPGYGGYSSCPPQNNPAPHPYFNNWRGARHHGNSQQYPAGNSYYYGAHSGSGNQGFGYRPIYYDHRY
uniref:DUF1618 domain-containing protein n=1 Tax=Aegilops tauschii TaxID=37682 RepID=M8CIH4_AEGTA